MASRSLPVARQPYHPPDGSNPYGNSNFKVQKVIGAALFLVGIVFSLYCAGSGISKLISVSLNNFGLLCLAGIINFIFWTFVLLPIFPFGGFIANSICVGGGVMVFGGLPAVPGGIVAFAGFLLFVNA